MLNPKLATDKPSEFWSGVKFLNIQRGGRSQHEMLPMFAVHLQQKTGLVLANLAGAQTPRRPLLIWMMDYLPAIASSMTFATG